MYRFIVDLLQPHTILFLWAAWALFRLWRTRADTRRRWWPALIPLLGLTALSMPAVAYLGLLSLESFAPPLAERPTDAEAIVVFSAGVHPPEGLRVRAEMDEDSVHRCLEAARLYRQGPPCLVLVSGGKVDPETPGPAFASVLGEFLELLGVKKTDLVLEEQSRTTYENALECAKLLNDRRISRVVLVADASDMWRAAACLRRQGIGVTPAPCHFRATRFRLSLFAFLPSPHGAAGIQKAWHEWLGIIWYLCRGRL
jgi:uncharacterized SAM-binding protein YcdF (DUF218 family)